jgi:hypothetical protein
VYFRLKCACGQHVTVSEGAAGVSVACPCGLPVAVPELTELRQRAAAGEIGCTLYADGEKRPPPPSPVSEATHKLACWLVVLVGGLITAAGALVLLAYGRIGFLVMAVGIALMGLAARARAQQSYLKAARQRELQEYASLTGSAHRSVGSPGADDAETSVTRRPGP